MVAADASTEAPLHHEFHIQIDRVHYEVEADHLTGAQLRQLPKPPTGSDRDLFEVVPGSPDRKIGDADVVKMHDGLRFFTAPAVINPGCER
jgi:hypothetical protein